MSPPAPASRWRPCRGRSPPRDRAGDTRAHVLAAAAELGYAPNRAARGLITGRTGNVGVIAPDLGNPYFHAVLKGAQARAREADYAVFVADGQEDAVEEEALIRAMSKQVDGMVLCSSRLAPARLARARADADDRAAQPPRARPARRSSSTAPAGCAGRCATWPSWAHVRCAFVAGPRRSWSNRSVCAGCAPAPAPPARRSVTIGPVAPQFASGARPPDRVLETGATAVLAYNDLVAVGILRRLAELGVAVPDELSVVGFDDIPLAAMVTPPLTTVAAPTELAGRAAVEACSTAWAPAPRAPAGSTVSRRRWSCAVRPHPPALTRRPRPSRSEHA